MIKCFRCGQQGHQASECLSPILQTRTPAISKMNKFPPKLLDKGKLARQAVEVPTPPSKWGETPDLEPRHHQRGQRSGSDGYNGQANNDSEEPLQVIQHEERIKKHTVKMEKEN